MATIKQDLQNDLQHSLSKASGGLIVRGLIALAFGIAIAVWPDISFNTLVLLVAAFATVVGVVSLVSAFGPMRGEQRAWLVFEGLAGIIVGVVTYFYPDITSLALLFVVGVWAIGLGVAQIVFAFRTDDMEGGTKFIVVLYGLLCIAFGMLMFIRPGAGAAALIALIAAFAIVMGTTLIVLGIQVRREGAETLDKVFAEPKAPTSEPTTGETKAS
jgi:uncharacterized membrane protein HdeD (DUF308 family)